MNYIEKAINHGLDDGFHGKPPDATSNDFPYHYFDDYYWGYRMGVLKKLNQKTVICANDCETCPRTNECETCKRKGQPGCPWSGTAWGRRVGNAFILLCTEWEA